MRLWQLLDKTDRLTLLVVLLLTLASYVAILIYVVLTGATLSPALIVMVTGWFFGAVMTFSFHKYREVKYNR